MFQKCLGVFSAVVLSISAFAISTSAATPEVALTFHDIDLTISGYLAETTARAYVIETDNGLLHVPSVLVDCVGRDCANL